MSRQLRQFTAIFEPDNESGGFTVTIPALPGCISEGETFEKALKNIQEAAELYLEVIKENEGIVPSEKEIIVTPIKVQV